MRDKEKQVDRVLGRVLAGGATLTTIFLLSNSNTDPVNVTKLFMGGISAMAAGAILFVYNFKKIFQSHRTILVISCLLLLSLANSLFTSGAPWSQSIYGTYGRNTGVLTYIFLLLILVSAVTLSTFESIRNSVYAILVAGFLNVVYCGWVLAFGDFIGWNNPYGNILGLLGNPNFISAFLGMFIAAAVSFALQDNMEVKRRSVLILFSIFAFYEIIKSHAIQGIVVTAGGLAIIFFFKLRSWLRNWVVTSLYSVLVVVSGIFSILGALQIGPMSFIYKRSVSLRGTYWETGINMGNEKPWSGVGMDAYGEWYRRMRPDRALIDTPGISTLSNASHNVVIDFFAFGGWPLLLSYVSLIGIGATAIIKVVIKQHTYDAVFVALASVWICYQVQSLISINQIGLAIWGWLYTGLLVAYAKVIKANELPETSTERRTSKNPRESVISAGLIAGIGALIGALIAVPPLNSDMKWYKAINSRNVQQVESALTSSYMNPDNSFKFAQAVQLFQASNLLELAHKYAFEAITFNPDYFDTWKQIYYLPNATENEKKEALANMIRLDPKNPDPTRNID